MRKQRNTIGQHGGSLQQVTGWPGETTTFDTEVGTIRRFAALTCWKSPQLANESLKIPKAGGSER